MSNQYQYFIKWWAFCIQSAFMVSLPEIVYLYQQNSLIVTNENMVKCNS